MNLLFYRYGSICEPDFIEGFKELGNTVDELTYEMEDKNIPPSLVQEGAKLQKILGLNSADKNAENIKTGSDAKLNYLCITKLQQVAQTQRVFRSSANMAKSDSRLIADVRLNGNQFYKMDCQLSGNRVVKLSLSKK